jgi:hypothetical protein
MHERKYKLRLTYKSTVDAFGHIDVIPSGPPGAVLSLLGINSDGLRGTGRLAQLARDTSLLAARITPQRMLPPEAGGEVSLLVGVVDGYLGLECDFAREPECAPDFGHEEDSGGAFENILPRRLGDLARVWT